MICFTGNRYAAVSKSSFCSCFNHFDVLFESDAVHCGLSCPKLVTAHCGGQQHVQVYKTSAGGSSKHFSQTSKHYIKL